MKRTGFTMKELIFVSVILGILTAIAVPKLAAIHSDKETIKTSLTSKPFFTANEISRKNLILSNRLLQLELKNLKATNKKLLETQQKLKYLTPINHNVTYDTGY